MSLFQQANIRCWQTNLYGFMAKIVLKKPAIAIDFTFFQGIEIRNRHFHFFDDIPAGNLS